jgi:hypothetical protein
MKNHLNFAIEGRDNFGVEITPLDGPSSGADLHDVLEMSSTSSGNEWDDTATTQKHTPPPAPPDEQPAPTPAAGVAPAVSASVKGTASSDADLDAEIPEETADILRLLRKIQNLPDRNDHAWRVKRDQKVHAISRRLHELANLKPVPPSIKRLGTRQRQVIDLIRRECAPQIAALQAADSEFHKTRANLIGEGLLPGEAVRLIEKIEIEIGRASDPAEIEKLVTRKTRLVVVAGSKNVQQNAVSTLNKAFSAMEPAVVALAKAIEGVLAKHEAQLVKAETEFFALHGLKHQRTQLSGIVPQVRTHLSGIMDTFQHVARQHENMHASTPVSFCPSTFAELFE